MVPIIPNQRQHTTNSAKPFNDLNKYLEGEVARQRELAQAMGQGVEQVDIWWKGESSKFNDLLNYTTAKVDQNTKAEKCIAIMTHAVRDISTASQEMNAVAAKNTRVSAPAYHFILSWPEHEKPEPKAVFDAAVHAIEALGLGQHQYIIAIHGNTDNMHAHISVNRVHPITFKSRNIEWAKKTLHKAARESEIKHDWTHDNGLWVVAIDGRGKKSVVINPDFESAFDANKHAHAELHKQATLPAWHDPDSFESWLKTTVSKAIRKDLKRLDGWPALHAWLGQYKLTLQNSGGGGMQLQGADPESGEIVTIPASKGLRDLKRKELEKQWGPFKEGIEIPIQVTDLSNLTPQQLQKGITHVISKTSLPKRVDPFGNARPPDHVLRPKQHRPENETSGGSGLYELPVSGVDGARPDGASVLPNPLSSGLGNTHAGKDQDVRRTESSEGRRRNLNRDLEKRAERKEQRALARADLRNRYGQYKRIVQANDADHALRIKVVKADRSRELANLRSRTYTARKTVTTSGLSSSVKLPTLIAIDAQAVQDRLAIEASYQAHMRELKVARQAPLGWRVWLYEQSNLGDKAAISALRGIVYQEKRDAKNGEGLNELEIAEAQETEENRYRKAVARLLKQERREAAIRSANQYTMRAYEADVLLQVYKGIQWNVTGNGNVEYRASNGVHLFTDRGNRVTFDKERVTDEEIRMALAHAEQKFGKEVMLTGDDPVFTARMAALADDMGLRVLNPELQGAITRHRQQSREEIAEPLPSTMDAGVRQATNDSAKVEELADQINDTLEGDTDKSKRTDIALETLLSTEQRLRAMVLAIDPQARFERADTDALNRRYIGLVAAQADDGQPGFVQHQGKSVYILHDFEVPPNYNDEVIEIAYHGKNKVPTVTVSNRGVGKTI